MAISVGRTSYAIPPIDLADAGTRTQFGVTANARLLTDGAMTSGSAVLTSATAAFTAGDVGRVVVVTGAGAAAAGLTTTVATYTSATQVTLANAAGTTVTNKTFCIGTDDQAGLQAALNALRPGQTLLLAEGKLYMHSNVLNMTVARTELNGSYSGTLIGYNQTYGAVRVAAANVRLCDIFLRAVGVSVRQTLPDSCGVFVDQVSGFFAERVVSTNHGATGFFLYGATDFECVDLVVQETWADGFHMTYGCTNGVVIRPVIINPADDGVAVVSYVADPIISSNIQIRSPRVWGQSAGRGVTCVGGTDITYTDVQVFGSSGAGIYLATEYSGGTSFYCRPITRVRVLGGRLSRSNVTASSDHGAVMIFNEQTSGVSSGIEVSDVLIENTRVGATQNVRLVFLNGATLANSVFSNIQITGQGPAADIGGTIAANAGYTTSGWDTSLKAFPVLFLAADVTTTVTTGANLFLWSVSSPGVYVIEMVGVDASSSTAQGPRYGVSGNVTTVTTTQTVVDQNTSATASTKSIGGWAAVLGTNVGTVNTNFNVTLRSLITVTALPAAGGGTLVVYWQMSGAGTGTLRAGAYARLTRVS